MKQSFAFIFLFLLSIIFSSCKKEKSATDYHSKASWVKIFDEGDVSMESNPYYSVPPIISAADGGMYAFYIFSINYNPTYNVIKLSGSGERLWKSKLSQLGNHIVAHELNDHSLLVFGESKSLHNIFYWYRISAEGKFMDSAQITVSLDAGAVPKDWTGSYYLGNNLAIADCADGGYMIAGSIPLSVTPTTYSNCEKIMFTYKLAPDLSTVAINDFVIPLAGKDFYDNSVNGIIRLPDNRFLLAGNYGWETTGDGLWGIMTCIINEDGTYADAKLFQTGGGTSNNTRAGFVPELGNLFVDGNGNYTTWAQPSLTSGCTDRDQRIVTFDTEGNYIDSVKYFSDVVSSIRSGIRKKENGFLLIGENFSPYSYYAGGKYESSIMFIGDNGQIENTIQPPTNNSMLFYSCCLLTDGHYAISGIVQEPGKDHFQLVVIKTDEDGLY